MQFWLVRKHIKAYLITDSKLYPTSPREFQNFYQRILDSHQIDFACYRDKQNVFNPSLLEVFLKLNQYCKIPSLVNSNLAIALKFGFDGLHCNGMQMQQIAEAKKKIPLVFYSAHSSKEILQADLEGANGITISPIFKTQNKGQPLGIDFLEKLNPKNYQAEIFALGGIIGAKEVEAISKTSIKNFASIRYFLS